MCNSSIAATTDVQKKPFSHLGLVAGGKRIDLLVNAAQSYGLPKRVSRSQEI